MIAILEAGLCPINFSFLPKKRAKICHQSVEFKIAKFRMFCPNKSPYYPKYNRNAKNHAKSGVEIKQTIKFTQYIRNYKAKYQDDMRKSRPEAPNITFNHAKLRNLVYLCFFYHISQAQLFYDRRCNLTEF